MELDAVMWPDAPWPVLRDEWLRAEDLGVRRGWLYDHLLLNGRTLWHDAFVTLAAAAAATSSIGLGTMVTSPNFRHPVTTAKAAQALSEVSDGRFVLGVGAGGPGADSDALGGPHLSRAERTARFREWTAMVDGVLSEPRVDVTGSFFSAREVDIGNSRSRPPLAIASTGRAGMGLAVRYGDLWITQDVSQDPRRYAGTPEAEVRRQLALLDEVCAEADRPPREVGRLVVLGFGGETPLESVDSFEDCVRRYAALGVDAIAVLWPRGDHADRQMAVLAAGAEALRA